MRRIHGRGRDGTQYAAFDKMILFKIGCRLRRGEIFNLCRVALKRPDGSNRIRRLVVGIKELLHNWCQFHQGIHGRCNRGNFRESRNGMNVACRDELVDRI